VIYCDSMVRRVDTYDKGVEFENDERYARGGTSFHDAFRWIEENSLNPSGIIVISDMELWDQNYPKDPGTPTLWIDVGKEPWGLPSFGKIVKVRLEN